MSSPLDGRIRKLAREEVTALLDSIKSPSAEMAGVGKPVQGGELQQQITDLHEHLHHAATSIKRLEDRIDALEKTSSATAVRRATRKASSSEGSA
jgi:cell division septum initiation protein DivIVA